MRQHCAIHVERELRARHIGDEQIGLPRREPLAGQQPRDTRHGGARDVFGQVGHQARAQPRFCFFRLTGEFANGLQALDRVVNGRRQPHGHRRDPVAWRRFHSAARTRVDRRDRNQRRLGQLPMAREVGTQCAAADCQHDIIDGRTLDQRPQLADVVQSKSHGIEHLMR